MLEEISIATKESGRLFGVIYSARGSDETYILYKV